MQRSIHAVLDGKKIPVAKTYGHPARRLRHLRVRRRQVGAEGWGGEAPGKPRPCRLRRSQLVPEEIKARLHGRRQAATAGAAGPNLVVKRHSRFRYTSLYNGRHK